MVLIPFRPDPTLPRIGVNSDELRRLIKLHNLSLEFRECFEFVVDLGVVGVNYMVTHILNDSKYIFVGPSDYQNWVQDDLTRVLRSKCYSVMLEFWVGHNRIAVCSRSGTNSTAFIINGTIAHQITPDSKQFIIDYCRISHLYPTLNSEPPKQSWDNQKILGLHCE